jgi:hypothetical protein
LIGLDEWKCCQHFKVVLDDVWRIRKAAMKCHGAKDVEAAQVIDPFESLRFAFFL